MPSSVSVDGHSVGARPTVDMPVVTFNYFNEMGMTVLQGRGFTADDLAGTMPVVVINEKMAKKYWGGPQPARRAHHRRRRAGLEITRAVVGVVNDVRGAGSRLGSLLQAYVPLTQASSSYMTLVLRTNSPAERMTPIVRAKRPLSTRIFPYRQSSRSVRC